MSDDIRITVLIDDKASRPGLKAGHGLSLWIEHREKRILFDTGQSGIVVENAKKLGVDLADTDAVVISHGHYDHTGGLSAVLDIATKAKIYLHPAAIVTKFSQKASTTKSIGMSVSAKKAIQGRNVIWTVTPAQLFPEMAVTGQVPRKNTFEDAGGPFFLDKNRQKADELLDDQSLFIESAKGLIVILGCAHSGVVNILNYATKLTGQNNIYGIIGGMHLLNAKDARISNTIDAFRSYDAQKIAPLHCTGQNALDEIKKTFPDRFLSLETGSKICF
ncbi:MAG: MBL fold metallo-hydrolase [Sedimentisphaerales bacterium]|nr:MBL fold metallo-hydrolase [Sedimentisphaerales bacterium]